MKKIFVLFLFLLTIHNVCYCQIGYFNNIYNFHNNHIAGLSIVKEDTTYVTASFIIDSTTYSRINFSRFDSNGNLMFEKNYGNDLRNYFPGNSGSLQLLSDGNFIIAGAVADPIYTNAFLLKVNRNFDSVIFKEFIDSAGSNHYEEFEQCKETKDKGFILCGAIQSGTHTDALLIIKTDSLGNQVFKKKYSLTGIDYVRDLIETTDKGFLLGCYSWDYYNASYSGDPWVLKLDSLGNHEWSRKFGGSNQDGAAHVALANDSNYIVAYSYAYYTMPQAGSNLKINVLKLDKNGNTIWDKQYDSVWASRFPNMVKVLTNGEIIVIGVTDFWDGINYFGASWVLKLKPNGDSVYFRKICKFNDEHTSMNTAYDFCINNDFSIVICGVVKQDTSYDNLWLVKMDSNGCLQPGCDPTGIKGIGHLPLDKLMVFPNPTTNQTTISYPQLINEGELQIYNTMGQLVYEEKLVKASSKNEINTQNFKAGLYKVIVREKGIIKGQVGLIKN